MPGENSSVQGRNVEEQSQVQVWNVTSTSHSWIRPPQVDNAPNRNDPLQVQLVSSTIPFQDREIIVMMNNLLGIDDE